MASLPKKSTLAEANLFDGTITAYPSWRATLMGHIESQVGWLAVTEHPGPVDPAASARVQAMQQRLITVWNWMRDPTNIAEAKLCIDTTDLLFTSGVAPVAAVAAHGAGAAAVAAVAAAPAGPDYIKILKSDFDTYRARMAQVYNHILASVTEGFKMTLINLKTTDPHVALTKLDNTYLGSIPEKTAELLRDEILAYKGQYVLGTAIRLTQALEDIGHKIASCPGEVYGYRESRRDLMRSIPDTGDWGAWKLLIDNTQSMTAGPPPTGGGAPITLWTDENRY
jgi:hypothetical protein